MNTRYTVISLTILLLLAVPISAYGIRRTCACSPSPFALFKQLSDTAGGFPTWDSDIINVKDFLGEDTGFTGEGVYIAVLDTGLVANWRDYFPADRIRDDLGKGFVEQVQIVNGEFVTTGVVHETTFIGSTGSGHGTHVTSTIIGYFYDSPSDLGTNELPPIVVRGIAPRANIIPVKVLETYNFPGFTGPGGVTFGTDRMVASGIRYATALKMAGFGPMIVTMSLGGDTPSTEIESAINDAIAAGVIVVASAGNDAAAGMGWPGAYPQVISAAASGWIYEWFRPSLVPPTPGTIGYRLWWLQSNLKLYNDIPEGGNAAATYVTLFSSRENQSRVPSFPQQVDVLAPGSWVRGPFPATPGYAHLPWWSQGVAAFTSPVLPGGNNFFYVGGTSMSAPHVTSVAALVLEKNPSLGQVAVESILKSSALPIPAGSVSVFDIADQDDDGTVREFITISWELESPPLEATGAGLLQANTALAATPP